MSIEPDSTEEWFAAWEIVTVLAAGRTYGIHLDEHDVMVGTDQTAVIGVLLELVCRLLASLPPEAVAETLQAWGRTTATRGAVVRAP